MRNFKLWVVKHMKRFLFCERRRRALEGFLNEYHQLDQLENDELLFEYIQTMVIYERRKWGLGVFATIVLCEILILPRCFSSAMEILLQYADLAGYGRMDVMKIGVMVLAIVIMSMIVSNGYLIISSLNDMSKINRKLLVIEEIKNIGK